MSIKNGYDEERTLLPLTPRVTVYDRKARGGPRAITLWRVDVIEYLTRAPERYFLSPTPRDPAEVLSGPLGDAPPPPVAA